MPTKKPSAKTVAAKKTTAKTPRVKKPAAPKKVSAVKKTVRRPTGKVSAAKPPQLPEAYGTGRLFLVARDPRWLYAHWDFSREEQRAFKADLILRVHRDSTSGALVSETELPADARHWFLPVARGETRYIAELGYNHPRGGWVVVATSDVVVTPSENIAPETYALFATIPQGVPFRKVLESIGAAVAENLPLVEIIRQFRGELPGFDVFPAGRNWTPQQTRELSRLAGVRQIRRLVRELASLTAANILPGDTEAPGEEDFFLRVVEQLERRLELMNPYAKGARLLLRLIAVGLVSIGGLNVWIEYLRHRNQQVELNPVTVVLNSLIFLAGLILLFASGKLADRIARYFDE